MSAQTGETSVVRMGGRAKRNLPFVGAAARVADRNSVRPGRDRGLLPVDFDQFREPVKSVGLYWLVTNQPVPVNSVRE
jgi:hypothetical protein